MFLVERSFLNTFLHIFLSSRSISSHIVLLHAKAKITASLSFFDSRKSVLNHNIFLKNFLKLTKTFCVMQMFKINGKKQGDSLIFQFYKSQSTQNHDARQKFHKCMHKIIFPSKNIKLFFQQKLLFQTSFLFIFPEIFPLCNSSRILIHSGLIPEVIFLGTNFWVVIKVRLFIQIICF